jgi:hypothetical protein
LDKIQQRALIVGAVGLIGCVAGAVLDLEQFLHSYLFGYVFWLGLGLGAFALLTLHNLVGGGWGFSIRRVLESSTKTIPILALLFLPILLGMGHIYEWSHADVVAHDKGLAHKALYLNTTFFIVRVVFYFVIWWGLSTLLLRKMRRQEESGGIFDPRGLQNYSAATLIILFLTGTFAAFDWLMSLDPHWYSTVYGMIFMVDAALSTFGFAIMMLVMMMNSSSSFGGRIKQVYVHDLGNLLFAFTMLWAYLSVSQLIILWSGNIPEEVLWYSHRIGGGWQVFPIILVIFHFAVPFLVLLLRKTKRTPKLLARVALLVIVMRFIDLYWLITPAFSPDHFHFSWIDIATPLFVGGAWLWYFAGRLKKETELIPLNTPYLVMEAAAEHG